VQGQPEEASVASDAQLSHATAEAASGGPPTMSSRPGVKRRYPFRGFCSILD
jgi:hypothetical protein